MSSLGRFRRLRPKGEDNFADKFESLQEVAKAEGVDLGDFVISRRGIFKKKKPVPSHLLPQIFKLQRSIITVESTPMVLVYNEDKSWLAEMPLTPEMANFFGTEFKKFVIAQPDAIHGKLEIISGISDQGW